MLSGSRIFGYIKTSQGGHMLTNDLLRKFLNDKSNWELMTITGNQKDQEDDTFLSRVAINA